MLLLLLFLYKRNDTFRGTNETYRLPLAFVIKYDGIFQHHFQIHTATKYG